MKKLCKIMSILMVVAVSLFASIFTANAVTTLPEKVVSNNELREVEYIKNFPVIVKKTTDGSYFYCMDMSATYAKNIQFNKTGAVADGYIYILNNKPNTGDKDKDFYITQMAVWYYEDYLNDNNFNLVKEVKQYILAHKESEEVSKTIYNLFLGARDYKAPVASLSLDKSAITFTEVDGYYVSSDIKLTYANLDAKLAYSLTGAPVGSKIVKDGDALRVKVPVTAVTSGTSINITMNVTGTYTKSQAFYYYNSSKYQKMLYQDALTTPTEVKDAVSMTLSKDVKEYPVRIDKTDITGTNEVAGATLVVKNTNGNVIDTWVSTLEPHYINLIPGNYTLTETIAPVGYKLSSTTIEFQVAENGSLFVKDTNGKYISADRVTMINELIDIVTFVKKDSVTKEQVAGATLQIKDKSGNIIKEFVTTNEAFKLELEAGYYTISETAAPAGYLLSNDVIYFYLAENGTLQVKNNEGKYVDTDMITFYNTKAVEEEVVVPSTGLESTALVIAGIILLVGGAYCVKKTIKQN